jgi:hypothetical protein
MRKENACDILQKMEAASLKNQMVLIWCLQTRWQN